MEFSGIGCLLTWDDEFLVNGGSRCQQGDAHDHKLVQALALKYLDEPFHMSPQIRRQRRVSFHNGSVEFQPFYSASVTHEIS